MDLKRAWVIPITIDSNSSSGPGFFFIVTIVRVRVLQCRTGSGFKYGGKNQGELDKRAPGRFLISMLKKTVANVQKQKKRHFLSLGGTVRSCCGQSDLQVLRLCGPVKNERDGKGVKKREYPVTRRDLT